MSIKLFINTSKLNINIINLIIKYNEFTLKSVEILYNTKKELKITLDKIKRILFKCVKNGFNGYVQNCLSDDIYKDVKRIHEKILNNKHNFIEFNYYDTIKSIRVILKSENIKAKSIEIGLLDYMD